MNSKSERHRVVRVGTVGSFPRARLLPEAPVVTRLSPHSPAVEEFRRLAVQVVESVPADRKGGYVLAVTSPDPQVGKTLTSLNLALTLAKGGERRVLLIEGDVWRPGLMGLVEVHYTVRSLAEVLEKNAPLHQAIASLHETGLSLIVAGEEGSVDEVMPGPRMNEIMAQVRRVYDVVVLDCPPMALASGHTLAGCADGILVVVGAGRTRRPYLEETLKHLGPSKVLGVVLNGVRENRTSYYSYARLYSEAGKDGRGRAARGLPGAQTGRRGRRRGAILAAGGLFLPLLIAGLLWVRERQGGPEAGALAGAGEGESAAAVVESTSPVGVEGMTRASTEGSAPPPAVSSAEEVDASGLAARTSARLNLRAGPGTQEPILMTLEEGAFLEVWERRAEWVRVRAQGIEGWVDSSFLVFTVPEATAEDPAAAGSTTARGSEGK